MPASGTRRGFNAAGRAALNLARFSRPPGTMGRPCALLDEEARTRFFEAVRAGVSLAAACALAGWDQSSIYLWRDRALAELELRDAGNPPDAAEQIYVDFYEQLQQDRAQLSARAVAEIQRAGRNDWRAWAWLLERVDPTWRLAAAEAEGDAEVASPGEEIVAAYSHIRTTLAPDDDIPAFTIDDPETAHG